jgi:hypothetical protein
MATDSVRSECIRLQAERVVDAYHKMRADTQDPDFKSGDFPVGRFAELVQQIKALEGWLEPASDEANDLHAQTVAEIREEHPDADEREVRLRVAIRESMGMTRNEEEAAYQRISKALS